MLKALRSICKHLETFKSIASPFFSTIHGLLRPFHFKHYKQQHLLLLLNASKNFQGASRSIPFGASIYDSQLVARPLEVEEQAKVGYIFFSPNPNRHVSDRCHPTVVVRLPDPP